MNYADIHMYDIANGPGIRLSLFVSGCSHACEGCFNKIAWDYNYGKSFSDAVMHKILDQLHEPCYSGMTFLGGEPLDPRNRKALAALAEAFKKRYPNLTLWIYTGYVYEDLSTLSDPALRSLLNCADVLVDGPFILAKKDVTLLYRGSSNQRLIDLNQTRKTDKIILWRDDTVSMSPLTH